MTATSRMADCRPAEIKDKTRKSDKPSYCYLIKSSTTRRTYIGATYDVKKRLRQHNGEICGGAKSTRRGRPWCLVLAVTGFHNWIEVLRFEWWMHHPGRLPKVLRPRGKASGLNWRLKVLGRVLCHSRWMVIPADRQLVIQWHQDPQSLVIDNPWSDLVTQDQINTSTN